MTRAGRWNNFENIRVKLGILPNPSLRRDYARIPRDFDNFLSRSAMMLILDDYLVAISTWMLNLHDAAFSYAQEEDLPGSILA